MAFLDKNNPASLEVSLGAGLLGAATAVVNWRLAAGEMDYVINDSGASSAEKPWMPHPVVRTA